MKQENRKNPKRLSLIVANGASELPYIPAAIFDRGENGYLNYCRFEVTGRQASGTHRTLRVDAISEEAALVTARDSGLSEPFEVKRCLHNLPSGMQKEYARDLGITLPEDVCAEDVACLIARAVEDDSGVPSSGLALYADRHGVRFSAWVGIRAFYNLLWQSLALHDRLCLFVYCVKCYLESSTVGDPDESDPAEYSRFADEALDNPEVVRAIDHTVGESLLGFDSYSAKTNTAAFTAAVAFLRGYKLA